MLTQRVREMAECDDTESLYKCLKKKTLTEITDIMRRVEATYDNSHMYLWHPVADDDFFGAGVINQDYDFPFQ